ncbi:MAG: hypothetical protein QGI09_02370, partial [Dehalococcoidia bacterium]|nr:hypothetical protein [Dehalococcoidia bacterium]
MKTAQRLPALRPDQQDSQKGLARPACVRLNRHRFPRSCKSGGMKRRVCRSRSWRRLTGLLVVGVLVASGCGGGSGEVSEPTTTSLVKNAVLTTSTSTLAPASSEYE